MKLTLYSTLDCHLCEQAAHLLTEVDTALELEYIDIASSEVLVEKYGIRIPVIKTESGNELGWPFDLEVLQQFVNENSSTN